VRQLCRESTPSNPVIPLFGFRIVGNLDRLGFVGVAIAGKDRPAFRVFIVMDAGAATRANEMSHESPSYERAHQRITARRVPPCPRQKQRTERNDHQPSRGLGEWASARGRGGET